MKAPTGGITSKVLLSLLTHNLEFYNLIDMIFVEVAPNDPFIGENTERHDKTKKTTDVIQWYTEVIVRNLLRARTPSPPAVMYVESAWNGYKWLQAMEKPTPMTVAQSFDGIAQLAHQQVVIPSGADEDANLGADEDANWLTSVGRMTSVLFYYQIPTVSAVDVLWPLAMHNRSAYWRGHEYSWMWNNLDRCCHPTHEGHMLLALLLAYNMEEEIRRWIHEPLRAIEEDVTMTRALEPPWLLTAKEDAEMGLRAAFSDMNFMLGAPEPSAIGHNEGWSWYADSKNKTGLIATRVGAHLSLKINVPAAAKVVIGFLQSYNTLTPAAWWVDEVAEGSTQCPQSADEPTRGRQYTIDPLKVNEKVSVYNSVSQPIQPTSAKDGIHYIHFCLIRRQKSDEINGKFKLMTVKVSADLTAG
eukprot:gene10614-12553_t